jgi:hypothetical protein
MEVEFITRMDNNDLANRFKFHPATETTGPTHDNVRYHCFTMAEWLNDVLPEGREKSLAITKLEEVMMWSNAAIARNG